MKEVIAKDKKLAQELYKMGESREVYLVEKLIELEEKIEGIKGIVVENVGNISEELKKKLESELVLEINKEELKGDRGDDGKDYVLTEQDKDEIATLAMMDIEVPVVEKVVEKTEVVRELPTTTENIVEVAKYQTGEEIVDSINSLDENAPRIDASHIKNLPESTKEIIREIGGAGNVEVYNQFGKVGSSQRLRFVGSTVAVDNDGAIKVTTTSSGGSSGFQLPTGTVDGSNLDFEFATAPNAICVDGSVLQKVDQIGTEHWSGTTSVTMKVAPNYSIFAVA